MKAVFLRRLTQQDPKTLNTAWIRYNINVKVWDVITYSFPSQTQRTHVWEWLRRFVK